MRPAVELVKASSAALFGARMVMLRAEVRAETSCG